MRVSVDAQGRLGHAQKPISTELCVCLSASVRRHKTKAVPSSSDKGFVRLFFLSEDRNRIAQTQTARHSEVKWFCPDRNGLGFLVTEQALTH